jgi:hypothetical protein
MKDLVFSGNNGNNGTKAVQPHTLGPTQDARTDDAPEGLVGKCLRPSGWRAGEMVA